MSQVPAVVHFSDIGDHGPPTALTRTYTTAEANGVADRLRVCLSDGFAATEIGEGAPYDLICANILADPLCAMAADLAHHLAPDGLAILSGLLRHQEAAVEGAYDQAGLRPADRIRIGDWSTLLLTY